MATWPEFRPTELLTRLIAHGVDFVVVGGIAMVGHGSARNTFDLDVCYAPDPRNLEALAAALSELGARRRGIEEDVPFVLDARTLRQTRILTLTTTAGDIDLLVDPGGSVGYQALRRGAERVTIDGVAFLIAGLDDLAAMKRTAGRAKDKLDLEELAVIRRRRGR